MPQTHELTLSTKSNYDPDYDAPLIRNIIVKTPKAFYENEVAEYNESYDEEGVFQAYECVYCGHTPPKLMLLYRAECATILQEQGHTLQESALLPLVYDEDDYKEEVRNEDESREEEQAREKAKQVKNPLVIVILDQDERIEYFVSIATLQKYDNYGPEWNLRARAELCCKDQHALYDLTFKAQESDTSFTWRISSLFRDIHPGFKFIPLNI